MNTRKNHLQKYGPKATGGDSNTQANSGDESQGSEDGGMDADAQGGIAEDENDEGMEALGKYNVHFSMQQKLALR